MTEERMQELRRLLEEAMGSLEIRYDHATGYIYEYSTTLSKREYRKFLHELWSTYTREPYWFYRSVAPHIVSETTKSKIVEFIRDELVPFIEGNFINFHCYGFVGSQTAGFSAELHKLGGQSLDDCLNHLLKIAVVYGEEEAVELFERCSRKVGVQSYFQHYKSLEGILLEADLPICDRVRLITVTDRRSNILPIKLMPFLSDFMHGMTDNSLRGKTLLIIDRPVFSIFSKPSQEPIQDGAGIDNLPFQLKIDGEQSADFTPVASFAAHYCKSLSIACDSAVEISGEGGIMEEGKFFHPGTGGASRGSRFLSPRDAVKIGESQIHEAMRLYRILEARPDLKERLQIPIDRWIMSKTSKRDVDKIIDLGIALEALYVTREDRIQKQLCHRGSLYLGKSETHREALGIELKAIYDYRCDVVHNRAPGNEVTIGTKTYSVADLVKKTQCLCRASILMFIKAGGFPDWNKVRQAAKDKWVSS